METDYKEKLRQRNGRRLSFAMESMLSLFYEMDEIQFITIALPVPLEEGGTRCETALMTNMSPHLVEKIISFLANNLDDSDFEEGHNGPESDETH